MTEKHTTASKGKLKGKVEKAPITKRKFSFPIDNARPVIIEAESHAAAYLEYQKRDA